MKKTKKIIIDAEPNDVALALIEKEKISPEYELKGLTYTLKKIQDSAIMPAGMKEYQITHCRLELVKIKVK